MDRRSQFDQVYMNIANEIASLSRAKKRKVGCIIVKDNNILSFGFNGTPRKFDNTCEVTVGSKIPDNFNQDGNYKYVETLQTLPEVLHAESNALMKLTCTTQSSEGASLYVTYAPCFDCAKLIIQAKIAEVIYRDIKDDYEGIKLLQKANIKTIQIVSNGVTVTNTNAITVTEHPKNQCCVAPEARIQLRKGSSKDGYTLLEFFNQGGYCLYGGLVIESVDDINGILLNANSQTLSIMNFILNGEHYVININNIFIPTIDDITIKGYSNLYQFFQVGHVKFMLPCSNECMKLDTLDQFKAGLKCNQGAYLTFIDAHGPCDYSINCNKVFE